MVTIDLFSVRIISFQRRLAVSAIFRNERVINLPNCFSLNRLSKILCDNA